MNIGKLRFKGSDVAADIVEKYGFDSDLLDIYAQNTGTVVHKWHHYLPIYDRYFSRYRGTDFKFLEIGVSEGGSLDMWRKYFGEKATIFGIDINPDCAQFDGKSGQVRIGSQDDEAFLAATVAEMGGVDVVLDDGSHHMDHIRKTLLALYPKVSQGGVYMIEDLHTIYWRRWGGGFRSKSNFWLMLRELLDDMHHWYHDRDHNYPSVMDMISGVHIHDSIVVFEKDNVFKPVHSKVGK